MVFTLVFIDKMDSNLREETESYIQDLKDSGQLKGELDSMGTANLFSFKDIGSEPMSISPLV